MGLQIFGFILFCQGFGWGYKLRVLYLGEFIIGIKNYFEISDNVD